MTQRTDAEIIYEALMKYRMCCNGKQKTILSQAKLISERARLIQLVEKHLLFWRSKKTSIVEKESLCNKGKKAYQDYCKQLKKNPDLETTRLAQKLDELLHYIAEFEASKMQVFRMKKIVGEKIDLATIFESEKNIRAFSNCPIQKFLEQILDKKEYTVLGKDDTAVYITVTGAKYHRADCPYCKGKNLIETTTSMVENIGMKPCKCINIEKVQVPTASANSSNQEKRYVTAFIDESIRHNVWHDLDASLPKTQSIFSYIICDGLLQTEEQITNDNTCYCGVERASNINEICAVAIEAIRKVLFQLAADGYKDNVLIYTDNSGAKDTWYKSKASKNLARLFAGVTVCQIPREKNAKADRLGRKRVIADLPVEFVERLQSSLEKMSQMQILGKLED